MKPEALPQAKEYWESIRELEREKFPEFKESDIYAPEGIIYFYFSPSWHFKDGLVTEQDISNFLSDKSKKLLSVGSGAAYLEKMLVELGIEKESITLSDIDEQDLPPDFESKVFDMFSEWAPLKGEMFDLIIFPESTLINVRCESQKEREDSLYHVLSRALQHLRPGGIIRINGHSQRKEIRDIVFERLLREYPDITAKHSKNLIFIKTPEEP